MWKYFWVLALILVLVIAGFFRLWQIKTLPAGLFPDEAANGEDVILILQGQHSPFFERGLGREALFFYLQALSVKVFGIGVWPLHLVSAIIGILTVLLTFLLVKKLFNLQVAFLTSFFLSASTWHTTLSRTGFRAILLPFFSTLFFYFVYLIYTANSQRKKIIFSILTGISLGLGFYTYISFRAMVLIIGFLGIILFFDKREVFKKFWREIIICFISALIVFTPLLIYFISHPDFFIGRSGYVSIFNPDLNKGDLLGTFGTVVKKTILMFFTEGDLNWRHNTSGFSMINPFISPFLALGFLFALIIVFAKIFRRKTAKDYFRYLFLLVWFLGMLIPEILTAEGIPHGLRAIGAMPPVFCFPALMIGYLLTKFNFSAVSSFPQKQKKMVPFRGLVIKIIIGVLFSLFLLMILFYDFYLYFGISANSPGFYYAYRSDLTVVSEYLNKRNLKEKTYLVLDEYSVQTPSFLTSQYNRPYRLLDPAKSYLVELKPGDQIVFTQSTIFDTQKFREYHPQAVIVKQEFNKFKQEILRVYEQ